VSEVVRVAGGPATRDVYSVRDGRPRWRAPLSQHLAERLEAA
jgi:pilus assembly protein CpaF